MLLLVFSGDKMTEKRFTYEYDEYNGNLFDNKMNTFYHIEDSDENIEVLCDRLNWLVEENEELKQKVDFYKYFQKDARELEKENERLKEERNYFERKKCEYFNKYNKKHLDNIQLKKENEQLKARIQYLERKIQRERNIHVKEHEKWENEIITENEKIKQQRDFYYARLQKIIKIADGDWE